MVGFFGGVFWGIFGDKKGRLSVLFGSILVYSLAILPVDFTLFSERAFSVSICRFKVYCRYWVAGELGAGITLVSESLPKNLRAIGTSVVAGFGLMGAVVAQLTVELAGGWNISYIIGGILGILFYY
jgi:MFS family permease